MERLPDTKKSPKSKGWVKPLGAVVWLTPPQAKQVAEAFNLIKEVKPTRLGLFLEKLGLKTYEVETQSAS